MASIAITLGALKHRCQIGVIKLKKNTIISGKFGILHKLCQNSWLMQNVTSHKEKAKLKFTILLIFDYFVLCGVLNDRVKRFGQILKCSKVINNC